MDLKFPRTGPLYALIEMIIDTAHVYREICKCLVEYKIKSKKESIEILKEIVACHDEFYSLFKNFSIRKASEFGGKKETVQQKIDRFLKTASPKEKRLGDYFDRLLHSIYELYNPLLTLYI